MCRGVLAIYIFPKDLYVDVRSEDSFDPTEMLRPFFDHEGVKLTGDKQNLIGNGLLMLVFADKKTAASYDLKHTGDASGKMTSNELNRISVYFKKIQYVLEVFFNGYKLK